MARPRKLESSQMIQIVDAYFTTETAGNPRRLKCSLLEEYAVRLGYQVKAYDFRRDAEVRKHMEDLKTMVQGEMGTRFMAGDSYKSLDTEKLMRCQRNPLTLKKTLIELDDYWKQIYDSSLHLAKKNKELMSELDNSKAKLEGIQKKEGQSQEKRKYSETENKKLITENRYLRKMLKTYLYPAIANEILKEERLLSSVDTQVTEIAMADLTDKFMPDSFTASVSIDRKRKAQEEKILEQKWQAAEEAPHD